ncbi:MAG: hypothetical protein IKW39_03280 [Alphaproteobacteria bacterium]|nr:hypothetical protein [Alphaproteobacteria bacterium]
MMNVSKLIKCLALSLIILSAEVKSANAFFLIPPMPWDIELNIPGNANKIVSNIKSYYRQIQALKTGKNTELLKSVKIGNVNLNEIINKNIELSMSENEKKGENKTVGKGAFVEDSQLGIEKDSVDEKQYYDAYYKLFFLLPPEESYSGNYNILETAFDEKRLDYQQDIVIDTYLYGRMNEDFLVLINKTVDRLDRCRIGELKDGDCIFFGLQYVYSDPNKEAPQGTEDEDEGSIGESMNAYIVSTVYDRMLRIIEDITAVEAIYRASKQIELVEPIKTTDASDYKPLKLQFAYKTTNVYNLAKLDYNDYKGGATVNSTKSFSEKCEKGGDGCATVNETSTETSSLDETKVLRELQPIEDLLTQTMMFHNLKKELPGYKDQYRKYLKSLEIHERSLKVLKDSDNCVMDFLSRHTNGNTNASQLWIGGLSLSEVNKHEKREGLSKKLIKEYEKYITDKIIDDKEDGICDGFYTKGTCPIGYRSDENNPCKEDGTKFPCIVDTIPTDTSEAESYTENSSEDSNDTDGFLDATKADAIENDNRMKAERSWRIGANAVEELTKQGVLTFEPWKDQQNIQKEYLTNKYKNIRTIINTTDKALASYMVGVTISNEKSLNQSAEPMENLLQKVTSIKTPDEAVGDGSAVKNAINNGKCPGFTFNGSIGIKTVTTTYTVPKTCSYTNSEGKITYYSCPETKHGSLNLHCTASKSGKVGYADITREDYVHGTKSDINKVVMTEAVDLRVKNNPSQYPGELKKAPTNLDSLINNTTDGCSNPPSWNLTTNGLVKAFMPAILGGCKGEVEAEQKYLYDTAKGLGRVVAKDLLDVVIKTREEKEKELKKSLKDNMDKVKKLERDRETLISSLNYWTAKAEQSTEKKNTVSSLIKDSNQRLISIEKEIANLKARISVVEDKKSKYGKMAEDSKAMAEKQIEMLKLEQDCIKSGEAFCKSCKNHDTCESDVIVSCSIDDVYCLDKNGVAYAKNSVDNEIDESKIGHNEAFISISYGEKEKDNIDKDIKRFNDYIKGIQEKIKTKESEIKAAKEKLADEYVSKSEETQTAIEDENKKYEAFVEKEHRMLGKEKCSGWPFKSCKQFKGDDGLEKTITEVLDDSKKSVKDYAVAKINETWFSEAGLSAVVSDLSALGIPEYINVADTLDLGMGVSIGPKVYAIKDLVIAVKDVIVDVASTQIQVNIKKADEIMTKELDAAIEEVNDWSGKKLCLPGEGESEISPDCKDNQNIANDSYNYMKLENYKEVSGSITSGHNSLLDKLIKPEDDILNRAGIKLKEVFGIPDGLGIDEEYFVALPARGVKKGETSTCKYDTDDSKDNDGCDYMSPRVPLAVTPPLREVFYFSSLDHDDIPSLGKKGVGDDEVVKNPSIANLLEQKYPEEGFEYLPEVWRYLLARPNMRDDGKYQQTFIERGYKQEEIVDYIASFDNNEVNATLSRGGIYPCKLSSVGVDTVGHKEVENVELGSRSNIPGGVAVIQCKEVAKYGKKLQHLLADFKSKNNPAVRDFKASKGEKIYKEQSELAQFLQKDGNKKLRYRDLLRSTFALLKGEDKAENNNDFTRQIAETISFKRNVMGSFLENVNAEFNMRKTKNNAEEDVKKTLTSLCEQIHQNGLVANTNETGLEGEEKTNACVNNIMNGEGLASSSSDDVYIPDDKSKDKTYYDTLFNLFDSEKNKKLDDAEKLLANIEKAYSDKELEKINERINEIEDLIKAFKGDADEVIYLKPGDNETTVGKTAIDGANIQREMELLKVEEAILSMDNQSRNVAYCPVY